MTFMQTDLAGAFVIAPERIEDERGFFARTWCANEFKAKSLDCRLVQCSLSYNSRKGTVRGMHLQTAPYEESKVVRCTRGAIYDVIIDLRAGSPTYRHWVAAELTADNRLGLYVPAGCAHGFQTLADETEVFYQISEFFQPESARGYRWDDPAFAIKWPLGATAISEKDRNYPLFGLAIDEA